MKLGLINKMVAIMCVSSISLSCFVPYVGAIKTEKGASPAASKRISELNDSCGKYHEKLTKIKEGIKQLKLKVKGKNERAEHILNNVIQGIDNSIGTIKDLDDVSLDNSIIDIEIEDDLKILSSRFRVLDYLLSHCKLNQESNNVEFIESKEMELEEYDELLLDETDELNKDLESGGVINVLLKYVFNVKDGLHNIKNKITRVADYCNNNVTIRAENVNTNDKISNNEELFNKIDKLYSNKNDTIEETTAKIIDIIKNTFQKTEDARLRAMIAFDVINKYKEQGIKRELIMKELVEPVVRDEMELSFKRCRENVSPIIAKKLDGLHEESLINNSISLAVESNANSLYEFCCLAFYGNTEKLGFYNWLDRIKDYFYDKYRQSRDNMVLPIIVDIVELNSLALRLEELDHIGCNADNIRKTSKIFDKIFNGRVDEDGNIVSEGMYSYLTGQSYASHLDREQKYFGPYPPFHELKCDFVELVNNLLVDNEKETYSKLKEKIHKSIEKIKLTVKQVDDKYSKLGTEFDIPGFTPESKKILYNMRLDFYEKMIDYEKWQDDNNLDNLYDLNNYAIIVMANFRKNKNKAQFEKLTSEEFIKSLEDMQSYFNENIKKVQRWQSYHKYRSESHRFLDTIEYHYPGIRRTWTTLFCEDSIFVSMLTDAREHYHKFVQNSSDQNIFEMEEISRRSITDMKNIKQNRFILEHEKNVKYLEDNFDFDVENEDGPRYKIAESAWNKHDEFKRYYEENRYDLSAEKIEHLKKLANEFEILLLQLGL